MADEGPPRTRPRGHGSSRLSRTTITSAPRPLAFQRLQLWWRAFLPTLFCQFIQVAALGLGIALGRALGPPAEAALAPLLGIATLALVLKVPGLLSAGFGHGASISGAAARSLALAGLARRALGRG